MAASDLIIGYVSLWFAWGALVGAVTFPRHARPRPLGLLSSASILGCALMPVVLLAFARRYTGWIPTRVSEMLSVMTPLLLGLFVVQQLRRRAQRLDRAEEGGPCARLDAGASSRRGAALSPSTRLRTREDEPTTGHGHSSRR